MMRKIYLGVFISILTGCAHDIEKPAPAKKQNSLSSISSISSSSASSKAKHYQYTSNERSRLAYCAALTDNAFSIARAKLKGKLQKDEKDLYHNQPLAQVTVPLVDKIYGEKFTHAWDYAVSFYEECAINVASIPKPNLDTASYCMQNAMIAGLAKDNKDSGVSKEATHDYFKSFNSETPHKIVDDVYAQTKPRSELVLGVWNNCVAPFAEP